MNLVTHIFQKDLRRSRVLLAVWVFLLVVQFGLIAFNFSLGDLTKEWIYLFVLMLAPACQALVLIVLIPHVVQDESLVGTTAFWLTRPISRATLFESKALFFAAALLGPALVVELGLLAASGASGRDLGLAAPEIVMTRLSLILPVAVLAAVTANFGRFAVAGAVAMIAAMFCQLAVSWVAISLHPMSMAFRSPSLVHSREVAGDVWIALAGAALLLHQCLTRRTTRSIVMGVACLFISIGIQAAWPWDFLKAPPLESSDASFNTAKVTPVLGSNISANDRVGGYQSAPMKEISATIRTLGVSPGYVVVAQNVDASLRGPGGEVVPVEAASRPVYGQRDVAAEEKALVGTPILNELGSVNYNNATSLFAIDGALYQKYLDEPLSLSAEIEFVASKYVVAAEMPLEKGAGYKHGPEQFFITDILKRTGGVEIVGRERRLSLLLDRRNQTSPAAGMNNEKVVYVLRNKKRNEAVVEGQNGSFNVEFSTGESLLTNRPVRISFGTAQNGGDGHLAPELMPEWLADASLVRLELEPVAVFSKYLTLDKFLLNGKMPPPSGMWQMVKADPTELRKIVLPEHATKAQVKDYITKVLTASRGQNSFGADDPQTAMLAAVGSENLDVLIPFAVRMGSESPGWYITGAIEELARPEDKALILQALPADPGLVRLVVKNGWQADARDILVRELDNPTPYRYLPPEWIEAVALLQDPSVYPELKAYLINGGNKAATFKAIKDLPGIELSDAVDQIWNKDKNSPNEWQLLEGVEIAASSGRVEALDAAASVLKKEKNRAIAGRARELLKRFTGATGDDKTILAWFDANRGKLVFDKARGQFVAPAAESPNRSPSA